MEIVIFKNFQKKKNSTLRPNLSYGIHKDVKLKGATSLRHPTFLLSDLDWTTETANYVWWNNRYYFVDDITYLNQNEYAMSCSIDVLATYKQQIGDYYAFIERCSNGSYYDSSVNDPYLSSKQMIVHRDEVVTSMSSYLSGTGFFIVRVVAPPGSDSPSTGVLTYCMDKDNLLKLVNYAMDDNNFTSVITEEAIKAVFDPFDYIKSVRWIPFAMGAGDSTIKTFSGSNYTSTVQLGWWSTNAQGYVVKTVAYGMKVPIGRPSAYYTDFRNTNGNYTKIQLYLPGVGVVNVDSIYNNMALTAEYLIDTSTGEGDVYLETGSNDYIIARYPCTLYANIELSQSSIDLKGAVASVVSAGANIAAGNYVTGVMGGVDAIGSILQPDQDSVGTQSNRASVGAVLSIHCLLTYYGTCEYATNVIGRPCMKNLYIANVGGYIKCGGASVPLTGQDDDRNEVNAYLNSGFYYE